MAETILSHIDLDSYQIPLKNLEDVHSKVMQSTAVLSLLGDWVCENSNSFFGIECKDKLMQILFLLIELLQDVESCCLMYN